MNPSRETECEYREYYMHRGTQISKAYGLSLTTV